MSRKAVVIAVVLASFVCVAGSLAPAIAKEAPPVWPENDNGEIEFKEVVEVEGVTAETLFSRARAWFSAEFVSGESVLDMEDRAAGKLIGKGKYVSTNFARGSFEFQVTVDIKDGRYRYLIDEIGTIWGTRPDRKAYVTTKANTLFWERLHEMIASLKKSMASTEGDDW